MSVVIKFSAPLPNGRSIRSLYNRRVHRFSLIDDYAIDCGVLRPSRADDDAERVTLVPRGSVVTFDLGADCPQNQLLSKPSENQRMYPIAQSQTIDVDWDQTFSAEIKITKTGKSMLSVG